MDKRIFEMEKFCLNDEFDFLKSLIGSQNLREDIEKRIGQVSARLHNIKINLRSLEETTNPTMEQIKESVKEPKNARQPKEPKGDSQ